MSPATTSHVGGINSVEKPRQIGCKTKFPCNLFKGDHLTHPCPRILVVRRLLSLYDIPSSLESSLVSQQPIQSLIDQVVVLMQYSINATLFLESDESTKVVTLMQSSVDPTLLLGSDLSFDYVFRISSSTPFEQGGIPLSSSMLPPSPRIVSFD
jgi:hypothetical protein